MAILSCTSFHFNVSSSASGSCSQSKYSAQSVRALPIRIITVGKKRSPGVQLLVDEYIGKLKHYCPVDDIQLRSNPRNARDVRAQVDDEDMAAMNLMKSDDWKNWWKELAIKICRVASAATVYAQWINRKKIIFQQSRPDSNEVYRSLKWKCDVEILLL
ncbi:putative RNA methyltransferase At5g10620 isoform X3 [Mercurialis annua]|uniref:putative RNA methyltransferase At5g10620 isoform X3 n=1 Tax=Mercurialis annua TaxID=3986 RepID=UPI002160F98C|nr:putative RNA methyltransferase At5g10620 isoform X3 [Mercurialis annua]